MKKRILSILLTLVMVIGMLPTVAFAADGTLTWGAESNGEPYVQWDIDEFSYGEFLWVNVLKDGRQLVGTDGAFTMHNYTGKLDLTEKIRNGGSGTYVVWITANSTSKKLESASKAFSFDQSLSDPVLTYEESTLTLSWNDVGADYYELDVLHNEVQVFADEKIAGTSIDLSEYTAAAGTYLFSLQAISEDFSCSSSKVKTMSITKGSTLPALSGLKVSGLTAFWNAFDEATRYWIRVIKVGGSQVVGEWVSAVNYDLNRAVSHNRGGEGTYQIDVTAYKNSAQISNAASVNFDFEFEDLLAFDYQSPEMPSGKTTTWLEYTDGESETFAFNHQYLDSNFIGLGYGVEKYARLEGLWGDLMTTVEDTTDVTDDFACGISHTFDKPGMYKLTETLRLKDKDGNIVATKTHVFNINVVAKPPVTPTITQQPTSVTNATGDSVTLTAKAENAERARWYVEKPDGTVVALGDAFTDGTSTQTISKASNAVGNRYFCAFWSEDDKIAKTDSVTVCFVPTVTNGSTVTVNAGQTAYLKVTASGCNHYADANGWYAPGASSEVSGSKYYPMGTTLCVSNVTAADAGTYTYKYVTEHGDVVTGTVDLVVNAGSSSATIDTFDIFGLDNPMILGTVADTEVSVPDDANYTVESVTCTFTNGSGVVTSANGSVSIKLKAKSGYTFASGDLAGTVEGIYKTVYSVPANATEITVTVDYNNYSNWKIAYPANDTISISTDSLTFKVGTAANGQKVEGAFNCTHSGLADTNLHHTGMKYAVYSIADNAMPAGLTLNADGTITGTPTTAGVYTVMVRADSVNASGTASNCSGLAVKAIEIIVEDKDAHTHDTTVVSDTATCTTDGVMTLKCGCTVESPAKGHDWGEWNDGYPIITPPCTADSDLVITRTCANDASHTESKTISRIHMAMDWSTDDNYHWKVCVYCNNALVVEPEAHTDANSDNKCDTCEYDMTPAVQPTKIDSITIEGLPAPEYGQIVAQYWAAYSQNETNGVLKINGEGLSGDYFGNLYFAGNELFDGNMDPYDDTDATFTPGTYYFYLCLRPANGYTFADSLNVSVKDVESANVDVDFSDKNDLTKPVYIYVEYEVTAPVVPVTYTITFDANGGSVSPASKETGTDGKLASLPTPTHSGSYSFDGWYSAKNGGTKITTSTVFTTDTTVYAHWTYTGGGGIVIPTVFPVNVKDSDNGEVKASAKYAAPGSTIKLTVTPDEGYELDTLTVKSGSKFIDVTEKNGKYQFVMPFGSVTVTATFKKIETPVVPDPVVPSFDDVAEDTYYFDAVEWAVENGITTGTSDTTFSPDMTCTRAQAVTFLWRAAGSPEPKSNVMPFEDVAAEAYYYKAVLWAVENGITKGTSATTFSPDADCTRAQIVTFLWRAQKSPAAIGVNPFTDVAADAYYVDAVLWAVEEKVTNGTSATTFSPDADCTRAQIVTFLYRALNGEE